MTLNYQELHHQMQALGDKALIREKDLQEKRQLAFALLKAYAGDLDALRAKVQRVAREFDANLRCACPVDPEVRLPEALDAAFPMPENSEQVIVLAADGSQIIPDRHIEVQYSLINLGAIRIEPGVASAPATWIESQLHYGDELYQRGKPITEAALALQRDLDERAILARLAEKESKPVVSFTDGPIELWGVREGQDQAGMRTAQARYLDALEKLHALGVTTAGYVDKPMANLVIRLLEVAVMGENELKNAGEVQHLLGVTDLEIYQNLLNPGERSAVFALQAQSASQYTGALALHFFYLNVGRLEQAHIARVEIPAWVAGNDRMLQRLQAVLVDQCRVFGSKPYPYALHRAHELALVSLQEKEQVTQMILLELRRRGLPVGELSTKQFAKNLAGRTSY